MTAEYVAYWGNAKKRDTPVNSFQAEIDAAKKQEKKVQRKPDYWFPDVRKKIVKKVIGPNSVDLEKKPEIQIYNTLQDIH